MIWKTKTKSFDLRSRALVMGVLNVTLDSFFDAGKFAAPEMAVSGALQMERDGAEIIDIGGESTRPGALAVSEAEELARVLPVIEALAVSDEKNGGKKLRAAMSIDTSKPAVARAALAAGAEIINDVTGFANDEMLAVARDTGAGIVIMHMQGTPGTMQRAPRYENVVREVRDFFRQSHERAVSSGIDAERIVFDPGIGFGKTLAHNLALLKNLETLRVGNRPLLIGVSYKSFIGSAIDDPLIANRAWPTVALTSFCRETGAQIFRVHDVRPNAEALRMTEAILSIS